MIPSNIPNFRQWFADNGDNTHNITYDLGESSIIMDFGGYTGVWVQQMINKYNPNVYIIEPIPEFFNGMVTKFSNNKKVRLLNVGVNTKNAEGVIYVSSDASSSNFEKGKSINVKFNTVEKILETWGLIEVDLLQINIEGDEYPVLEHMLETNIVTKFKNLQIQFHLGIKDDFIRREKIREGLISKGFVNKFDYPFVWESWYKQ